MNVKFDFAPYYLLPRRGFTSILKKKLKKCSQKRAVPEVKCGGKRAGMGLWVG